MLGLEKFWPTQMEPDDDDDTPSLVGVRLASSEWERRTARLERLADGLEPSGLIEWRYAPARVSWTKDPPTQPGLYFVKVPPDGPCRVVEVYWQGSMLLGEWSDIQPFPVARSGYLFSDHKLQEPT